MYISLPVSVCKVHDKSVSDEISYALQSKKEKMIVEGNPILIRKLCPERRTKGGMVTVKMLY